MQESKIQLEQQLGKQKGETKVVKKSTTVEAPKYSEIIVQIGAYGSENAVAIMGRVANALRKAKVPQEEINQYLNESMSGDYDNLRNTATRWVTTK